MTLIYGHELVVGDAIEWLGGTYEITSFEGHPGLTQEGVHYPARAAVSDPEPLDLERERWAMTVFDDDAYKVELGTRPGNRIVRLHN